MKRTNFKWEEAMKVKLGLMIFLYLDATLLLNTKLMAFILRITRASLELQSCLNRLIRFNQNIPVLFRLGELWSHLQLGTQIQINSLMILAIRLCWKEREPQGRRRWKLIRNEHYFQALLLCNPFIKNIKIIKKITMGACCTSDRKEAENATIT